MNTVEDAIYYLYERSDNLSAFDRSFVENMVGFDLQSKPYTSKQLDVCVKILSKYTHLYENPNSVQQLITNKYCRRTPIPSIEYVSQIRYAGGNLLLLRCKYSDQTIKALKQMAKSDEIRFDSTSKVWCISVSSGNLDRVMKFIQSFKIEYDDAVVAFLAECDTSRSTISSASIIEPHTIQVLSRNNPLLDRWLSSMVSWSEPNV